MLNRSDESGAIALIAALVSIVLMVVCAFVVDIGGTWARRGQLQVQADRAAVFAADYLPVADASDRKAVAAQVAYYIACHTVEGQRELTPAIPSCTSSTGPSDPAIKTYGDALLTAGQVSFPSATRIKVVTPPARVDFSFGQAAGADGTTQQKTAIAKVGSPGDIVPIGLSMNCMLSVANNLPGLGDTLTGVLPLNYMSVGPIGAASPKTTWPGSDPVDKNIVMSSITPGGTVMGTGGVFTVTGSGWEGSVLNILPQVKVYFRLGDLVYSADAVGLNVLNAVDTATFTLPAEVAAKAGTWQVKVAVKSGTQWTYAKFSTDFTVSIPAATADLLGCGRALKSPRGCTALIATASCTNQGNFGNLTQNLQEGIDHGLVAQSGLISATVPSTVPDLLNAVNDPAVLFKCSNNPGSTDYKDIAGNLQTGKTPNCVHMEQGSSDADEFTAGFLGAPTTTSTGTVAGRLVCTAQRPCSSHFRQPIDSSSLGLTGGYQVNDDHFTDFVTGDSPLDAAMFFNLTTYITPGLPVVTPTSRIDPAIYGSQRFFWVPVLSLPVQSNGNQAGDYPILTFRPVFVTQAQPSGVAAVDMVLGLVDSWVRSLLGIDASDDHGIMMNDADHTLRALRFMTIEPTALPGVPADYQGPISEYVGTGPKIVRLVK
jgi:hypothetical protein